MNKVLTNQSHKQMKRTVDIRRKALSKFLCFTFIVISFTGCAITQKDLEFTWERMKEYYGDTSTPIPRISVVNKKMYNDEGYQVRGAYIAAQHLVELYDGYDYETIEHEFHHALGNRLGETKKCRIDYKTNQFFCHRL